MKINLSEKPPHLIETGAIVIPLFQDENYPPFLKNIDSKCGDIIQAALRAGEFQGKPNTTEVLHTTLPSKRILLIGLGKKAAYNIDLVRQASATAVIVLRDMNVLDYTFLETKLPKTTPEACAQAFAEGTLLGMYKFVDLKTEEPKELKKNIKSATYLCKKSKKLQDAITRGTVLAEAANYSRTISDTPANIATPTLIEKEAKKLAQQHKLKLKIIDKTTAKKLGLNAFLSVSSGSTQPPKFIILEYNPKGKKTIVLVGKTITFDAGGISLKPSRKMWEMKYDKCGGTATLGIIKAAAQLKLPHHIVALIPATENMPGGSAARPGDIVKNYSGKTIEILNTDAEGRLIMSDAIAYSKNYKPSLIIDMATLTGSVVVALGSYAAGLLGNNDALAKKMIAAGERTGERVWQLPLFPEYEAMMESKFADIKNISETSEAGTITAAAFLKKFVPEKVDWLHLDIAGTSWVTLPMPKPYQGGGATGFGIRLMIDFLQNLK